MSSSDFRLPDLQRLAFEVDQSREQVVGNLASLGSTVSIWWAGMHGEMPEWAKNHIQLHREFQNRVNDFSYKSEEDIPREVLQILDKSDKVVTELAQKVDYSAFLALGLEKEGTVDENHLLTSKKGAKIAHSQKEWHLNLGLLMTLYNKTEDPEMKKLIEFLALNYLAKAAPIDLSQLRLGAVDTSELEKMFQFGVMQQMAYHREDSIYEPHISAQIQKTLAVDPSSAWGYFFLTDTTEYQEILPLFFNMMDMSKEIIAESTEGWSNNLTDALEEHFKTNSQDPYKQPIDPRITVDLTDLIGEEIQTNGDPSKEAQYASKIAEIESEMERAIEMTIEKIKNKYPELLQTAEDETKLRVFLKFNILSICRTEINETAVLKSVFLFADPSHYLLPEGTSQFLRLKGDSDYLSKAICSDKTPFASNGLHAFVNYSGMRLGGVSGRQKVFNFMNLEEFLRSIHGGHQIAEYKVHGKNVEAYKKDEVLTSNLFQGFQMEMNDPALAEDKPQIAILGKATANTFAGLLAEISKKKWEELNRNPETRMILQQSLFRAMQHFASARSSKNDFNTFALKMELAQCEIATILAITSPFKDADFQKIYIDRLTVIPEQFRDHAKAGVAKSAMNVFAGVNAAVYEMNPSLERAHCEGAYFEQVAFLGKNRTTQEVLSNPEVKSVDLYVGEFNHNIDIHMKHHHYSQGAVCEDIKQILEQKKDTEHLTVAIDVTVDLVNSPDVQALLEDETLSKEIQSGRLNVVFFRSGQKFDMLGFDNYYGAPFWMVNNGKEQWKGFDRLMTSPAHKTDSLSMQWLCLVNKYAPQSLDDYRNRIFANARNILDRVPEDFTLGGKYAEVVRISTVDNAMQPNFIDLKILHPKCGPIGSKMKTQLAKRFKDAGVKIHQRGSFGFYHVNWNTIAAFHDDAGPRNIRINPGLNIAENQIILDFIREDLPKICDEFSALP